MQDLVERQVARDERQHFGQHAAVFFPIFGRKAARDNPRRRSNDAISLSMVAQAVTSGFFVARRMLQRGSLHPVPRSRPKRQRQHEASRLRRLRTTLGLTQRELAEEFHVAHGAISGWESGKQTLPGPILKLLELYEEELGIGANDNALVRLKTSMLARNVALSSAATAAILQCTAMWLQGMLSSDERRNAITARAHSAIARNIVATLGELKGVAMKLGQTLSYMGYALPEGMRAELATLQAASRPMSPAAISEIFLQEFGEPPRQLFSEWSSTPFAAASIGQVHRARLKSGEEVAVKVQYPAVADAMEADLRSAAVIDRLCGLLFRGQDRGSFLAEVRERFSEECDYFREAANQEEFRKLWAGKPGVRIPRVHHAFTRKRVLVSELVHGQTLECFASHASQSERNQAGATLWQFSYESMLRHGIFHADPHPGNFLFADGDVIVLDFGCVKRFPAELILSWRQILRAALERRRGDVYALLARSGIAPDMSRYDFDYHANAMLKFYVPWLRDERFRFTPQFAEDVWRAAVPDNPNKFRSNVPRDWFFADRLQFGLYMLLARLQVEAEFRQRILDLLYESNEPRPEEFSALEMSMLTT
jgi:predicted unusual protein kinase regulating ubiquinone biosynthesis (AarF/ABC1/UbiB family)/DNA-binding transcriptional regulator YiaG